MHIEPNHLWLTSKRPKFSHAMNSSVSLKNTPQDTGYPRKRLLKKATFYNSLLLFGSIGTDPPSGICRSEGDKIESIAEKVLGFSFSKNILHYNAGRA